MKILTITLVFLLFVSSPAWTQTAKPVSLADLAAYAGADRERVLLDGAKREGKLVWYTTLAADQNKQLRAGYKGSYAFREKIDIEGLNHPKRMFDLTEGLIRRKYSSTAIQGILGGNFKRVLSVIWNT